MRKKAYISDLIFILCVLALSSCGMGVAHFGSSGAPTITGASTTPNGDGTVTVTITGTGFVDGVTVTISGVSCTNVHVISTTKLTCILPNGTIALVNIVVTSPSTGSSGSTTAYHTLFATSVSHVGGEIGSVAGGDTICQSAAQAGSKTSTLTGTWRAILSDQNANAKDRITFLSGSLIKNTNGDVVVATSSNLWSGTLQNAVHYDENGNTVGGFLDFVWTGTQSNGIKQPGFPNNEFCSLNNTTDSWDGDVSDTGSTGDSTAKDQNWLDDHSNTQQCNGFGSHPGRLYCINSNN